MQKLQGTLFRYGPKSAQVAFMSGAGVGLRHAVFVGGLTDGLLCTKYIVPLAEALEQKNWCCVQPLLSSSHQGWGVSSLDQDAQELWELMKCLKQQWESQGVVLIGHSTGCQDAVRYAERHGRCLEAATLLGAILQAPVSDREYLATLPHTVQRLEAAHELMSSGKGEEIVFRDYDSDAAAVCARRWLSLAEAGGDDDMFSEGFTQEELQDKLSPLSGFRTLLMLSECDEYVPQHVDVKAFGERMVKALGPHASLAIIPGANHVLAGCESVAVDHMMQFIMKC